MKNATAFTIGCLVGAGSTLGALWNADSIHTSAEPVHYEHVLDIPRTAGESVMMALVVEREVRPQGERRLSQPAWTRIIGCPEPPNVGPMIFKVSDDGLWNEVKEGQFVPVTYFKWPGTADAPPRYEFRGYAVQEAVSK